MQIQLSSDEKTVCVMVEDEWEIILEVANWLDQVGDCLADEDVYTEDLEEEVIKNVEDFLANYQTYKLQGIIVMESISEVLKDAIPTELTYAEIGFINPTDTIYSFIPTEAADGKPLEDIWDDAADLAKTILQNGFSC